MNHSYTRPSALMRSLAALQAALTIFALVAMSSPLMVMAQETTPPAEENSSSEETSSEEGEQEENTSDEEGTDESFDETIEEGNEELAPQIESFSTEGGSSDESSMTEEEIRTEEEAMDDDFESASIVPSEESDFSVETFGFLKPKLKIKKELVNDDGGTASADDFSFVITKHRIILPDQSITVPMESDGTVEVFVDPTLNLGRFGHQYYSVEEVSADGYVTTYENCEDLEFGYGDRETCTVTNDDEEPEVPEICTILSDEVDFVVEKNDNAIELVPPYLHDAWADMVGGSWIWGDSQVQNPQTEETQTFKKNFEVSQEPTSAMLHIAADNGARVLVNGEEVLNQLVGLDSSDQNYNDANTQVIDILEHIVVGDTNTIEVIVKNLADPSGDATSNPAGLNYKIVFEDAACEASEYTPEPEEETATLHATKIVCEDESYLPNWSGGDDITSTTATDFLADVNEGKNKPVCWLEDGWEFQWVSDSQSNSNPGNNLPEAVAPWTTFGMTDVNGMASTEIPAGGKVWVREVMQPGYQEFSGGNDVSAEMWCGTDVLNYDNWDWVEPVEADEHYYCVALNAVSEDICEPEAQTILLSSDAEENVLLTEDETGPASVVSWLHSSWVQQIGEWIWKDTGTSADDAANGTDETFTRTFEIIGTPKDSQLEIAADNQYEVWVNGTLLVADTGEFNYGATETHAIDADLLVGGMNEIKFVITNIDHADANTPDTNPAGLLYKITVNNDECDPYEPPTPTKAIVKATKVMCDAEEFLPNLSGGDNITSSTAQDWVNQSEGHCWLEDGYTFQWAPGNTSDPEDNGTTPLGAPWVSSAPTNVQGMTTMEVPVADAGDAIQVREVLKEGDVPFSGSNSDVSAELYCHGDVMNYDNWDWIGYPEVGQTYYCVAFNANEDAENPNDPDTSGPDKVHIYKYLKNGETTTQVPNDSTAPSFPMVSTWQIGEAATSSGSYVLGNNEGGTALRYAADTSAMANGSYYTTSEVTDGSVVVATDGVCSEGKYRLLGYKSGNSLAAAEAAALSTTAPEFYNITTDKYVIVVNEACGTDGGGDDEEATITIVKNSVGGTGTFDFTVDEELVAGAVTPDATLDTTGDGNDSEDVVVEPGTYTVTELAQEGWTLQSASCEFDNESFSTEVAFDTTVTVEDGDHVTCTFTNTKDGENTQTSNTTVITGNTSAGENQPGWFFNRDLTTQSPFEFTLDEQSIGNGSLHIFPIENDVNGNSDKFIAELFDPMTIDELESFSFDFMIDGTDSTVEEHFYLNIYANFGESSPTKFYDCRYSVIATVGSTGGFTTVTFDPSQAYSVTTRGGAQASPYTCPAIPADMDSLSTGDSVIRAFAINVGDTSGNDLGVGGYLDNVQVVTTAGTNTHTETYDFEPAPVTPQDDGGNNRGSTGNRVRSSSSNNGQVLGATTECSPLLMTYLGRSYANAPEEVTKLQNFLNSTQNANIPVTGMFDAATEQAVRVFQVKYWEAVLQPWFAYPEYGVLDSDDSTGIVYKTTKWQINDLFCPGSEALPTLP